MDLGTTSALFGGQIRTEPKVLIDKLRTTACGYEVFVGYIRVLDMNYGAI
jgi:hypothetical protein